MLAQNGVACIGTIVKQTYADSTIILESADDTFAETLRTASGATNTEMESADGGKTWTIAKITIPAMK